MTSTHQPFHAAIAQFTGQESTCGLFLRSLPAMSESRAYVAAAWSQTHLSENLEVAPQPIMAVMRCEISYAPPEP